MAVCARARAAPRSATGARKAPRRAREGPQAAAAGAGAGTGAAAAAHGVPTVDVSALAEGADAGARARCVAELRDACATVGFFYAVGHGIAHERSRDTLAVAARFFALPAETKRALDYRHSYAFRGYISRGAENTAGVVDEREQVEIGDEAPAHADPTCVRPYYERLRGPNQWPAEEDCPGFRTELEAFAADMQALSMRLTGALAESLGLPATHFDPLFDEPHTQLKVCHYPALEAVDANASGVGAHSDSGFLSLLLQDDAGGLQVQLASGEWIDAPPVEGSFVVNLGEMMQLASGGRYFFNPRLDASVAQLAELAGGGTDGGVDASATHGGRNKLSAEYGVNAFKSLARSHPTVLAAHHPDLCLVDGVVVDAQGARSSA